MKQPKDVLLENFPVLTRAVSQILELEGKTIELQAIYQAYEDKICLSISHTGRIAQIISVKLEGRDPYDEDSQEGDLLPMAHLTSKFLLGSNDSLRSDMSSLLAVQIGSLILSLNSKENRELLLSLTLPGSQSFWADNRRQTSDLFHAMIELATTILAQAR